MPPNDDGPSSNEANDDEGTDDAVLVAASTEDLQVWESPNDDEPAVETLRADGQISGEAVSVVVGQRGRDWLEVELPTAPAGHTGWIKRADVTLSRHRFRIEVSLSGHTLTLHTGETEALSARVAIGTADRPEPGTTLFIKDLVKPPNTAGPYARYAYGLSGSANDLAAFQAGSRRGRDPRRGGSVDARPRRADRIDRGRTGHHVPDGGDVRAPAGHSGRRRRVRT